LPLCIAPLAAGCGGAMHGLPPDAPVTQPPAVRADGRLSGVALGWSLGGEVHLLVPGDDFARALYERIEGARPYDSAFIRRPLITFDADSLRRDARDDPAAATILSSGGAVPARLSLVRWHAAAMCSPPGVVTELVYRYDQGDLPRVPRAHSIVIGVLGTRQEARALPSRRRRRIDSTAVLLDRMALAAGRSGRSRDTVVLLVRPVSDPDRAIDAGEAIPLDSSGSPLATGVRARIRTTRGDTLFVGGIALAGSGRHFTWVIGPLRAPLSGGVTSARRPVLRGATAGLRAHHSLLIVDEMADVAAADSRTIVVDPGTRRLLASQPLALRCRDR
jgi:hypothetical protein